MKIVRITRTSTTKTVRVKTVSTTTRILAIATTTYIKSCKKNENQ